jgi:hypothetical protein
MLGFPLTKLMRFRQGRSSEQGRNVVAAVASQPLGCDALTGSVAGQKPEAIEIRGVSIGMAVQHALGYRFVAVGHSVFDMTESIWPTLEDLRRAVAQHHRAFLRAGSRPFPGRRSPRPGAVPVPNDEPALFGRVRLALNCFGL